MTSSILHLESFDGVAPAIIHDAPTPDEVELLKQAAAAQAEALKLAEDARLRAEAEHHAQLLGELARLGEQVKEHRTAAIQAVSSTLGTAAQKMFPVMTDAGFAEEIAAASAEVVTATDLPRACLNVASADHDRIVAALEAIAPHKEIVVANRPDLAPGCAQLVWDGGGADFDAAQIAQLGKEHVERSVERLLRSQPDE